MDKKSTIKVAGAVAAASAITYTIISTISKQHSKRIDEGRGDEMGKVYEEISKLFAKRLPIPGLDNLVNNDKMWSFLDNKLTWYSGYSNARKSFEARMLPPNKVVDACVPELSRVYELALIAKDVYKIFNAQLTGGWKESKLAVRGVVYEDETGLVSKLYERTVARSKEYVYAMAGTDPLNFQDIKADILQVFGKVDQYEHALMNAKILSDYLGDNPLTFVGHSLGGGEAAYCAMNLPGRTAVTFNPAGVQLKNTDHSKHQSNIKSFILMNDPLNIAQDLGFDIIPQADGIRHYIAPDSQYWGHDINAIIDALRRYCNNAEA